MKADFKRVLEESRVESRAAAKKERDQRNGSIYRERFSAENNNYLNKKQEVDAEEMIVKDNQTRFSSSGR